MIVRILHDRWKHLGLYQDLHDDINYNQLDDSRFNVTSWLVLTMDMAEELRREMKPISLEIGEKNQASYGIYEMDEMDVALWLLKC